MNIQDNIQEIHKKFGITELANYKIEQFIEGLIDKEVKRIANDIMDLGLELRQNQLNGLDGRSGKEVLTDYFNKP